MKKTNLLSSKAIITILVISLSLLGCSKKVRQDFFSFAFITDVHITPELNAVQGFQKAIDTINYFNPDFVLTGGDLIMDALGQSYERADSLFNLYQETASAFKMPVYNTIGNHEHYGLYSRSGADPEHPEFGKKMFEKRIGKSYYSFEHKGWKFMSLNSTEDTRRDKYIGHIDEEQIEWIKEELQKTDSETPIVISTHIPFITAFTQKYIGNIVANDSSRVINNGKEVIDLFDKHNLKLVLQGHLHIEEVIFIDGVHFITGGSICAGWWRGPRFGFEESFLMIDVKGDEFKWRFIDYNWPAEKYQLENK